MQVMNPRAPDLEADAEILQPETEEDRNTGIGISRTSIPAINRSGDLVIRLVI